MATAEAAANHAAPIPGEVVNMLAGRVLPPLSPFIDRAAGLDATVLGKSSRLMTLPCQTPPGVRLGTPSARVTSLHHRGPGELLMRLGCEGRGWSHVAAAARPQGPADGELQLPGRRHAGLAAVLFGLSTALAPPPSVQAGPQPLPGEDGKLPVLYLPKSFNGKRILVEEGENSWRVDNSQLQADTDGIGYRLSKDITDKDPSSTLAKWGSTIEGADAGVDGSGTGWVEVTIKKPEQKAVADTFLDGPDGLRYQDLVAGEGSAVSKGNKLRVNYILNVLSTGVNVETEKEFSFDTSSERFLPGFLLSVLGKGGMAPMKEGGVRQVLIPPDLGYGDKVGACDSRQAKVGQYCKVPPKSTLELIIDLKSIQK